MVVVILIDLIDSRVKHYHIADLVVLHSPTYVSKIGESWLIERL